MEKEKKQDWKDPYDGEYIGNIWGWKTSFIGLGVLLFLLALMLYRHYQLDDWRLMIEETPKTEIEK